MVTADVEDFKDCVEPYDMTQNIYKGNPFIYTNGRTGEDCIFEKSIGCLFMMIFSVRLILLRWNI